MNNELIVHIRGDIADFKRKMAEVKATTDQVGKKMQDVGKKMTTYVTLPIFAMGAAAVKMASDYEESLNKVDVAFKENSEEVRKWSNTTLKNFGIAKGSALDMAALFGDMGTSMGLSTEAAAKMSTSLVGLAGDMASFKNIGIGQATTALNSIFTGETESLKLLGIVMTEANLKVFALSQGIRKSIQDMTQAEKVNLRYAYVMKMSSNAQGDFARTGGGAANQMRIFQESMKQLGQSFGEVILPMFTKIITKVNQFVQQFSDLDKGTKKIILVVAGLAAVIGPLLVSLGFLIQTIIPALIAGGAAIASAWLPATLVLMGVAAAISSIRKEADKMKGVVGEAAKTMSLEEWEKQWDAAELRIIKAKQDLASLSPLEKWGVLPTPRATRLNDELASAEREIKFLQDVKKQMESLSKVQVEDNPFTKLKDDYDKLLESLRVGTVELFKIDIPENVIAQKLEKVKSNFTSLIDEGDKLKASLLGMFKPLEKELIDLTAAFETLFVDVLSQIGAGLGDALMGNFDKKEFGKGFLMMLADFGQKVGGILIAYGLSVEAFKASFKTLNGVGLIIAGGALLIAASAAKAALSTPPTQGGGQGGSSSSGSGGDAFGIRNLRDFKVEVSGVLSASGNELIAVISNENKRKTL